MNDSTKNILKAIKADIETLAQLIFETDTISNNTKVKDLYILYLISLAEY